MAATVDIVVRTKDRPLFLKRALASIAGQTFEDWRVVIVNDGGDPGLVRDVVAAAGVDHKTTIFDHGSSWGRWPSANHGVREATAPFLVLHDDDDTWDRRFLQRAVEYLEREPASVGVVSRIEIVWERFDGTQFHETGREVFQPQLSAPLLSDVLLFNRFVPIGFLYRRELHEELGPYREDLAVVGDWEFNLRVLSRWPLEYLDGRALAFWHQRPDARGSDGNSVIAERDGHEAHDLLVRDAYLRERIQRDGAGDLLYLTKFIDRRFLDIEGHIDERIQRHSNEIKALVHENRPGLFLRALWRRLRKGSRV
ncbi:glycosyltransferase family 2 protein [uncultured Aeromicrobium sp.]|uniref:glycosyltransferase family 2 protein n=1 Tax=uncultured Aeromicrobium sp. TaxID=337820 RepID=UPI0025E0EB0C|nr:glycosyltransferase family 2 protein [uncultured Aeromicrobium sp.]